MAFLNKHLHVCCQLWISGSGILLILVTFLLKLFSQVNLHYEMSVPCCLVSAWSLFWFRSDLERRNLGSRIYGTLWFPNLRRHRNPLEGLLKHHTASDSGLGWGLEICISNNARRLSLLAHGEPLCCSV